MVNLVPNVAGTTMRLLGAVAATIALEPKFVAILVHSGCLIMMVTFFRRVLKHLHKEARETIVNRRPYWKTRVKGRYFF